MITIVTRQKRSQKSMLTVRPKQAPTPLRFAVVIPAYAPVKNIPATQIKPTVKWRKIKEFSAWYKESMKDIQPPERPPCTKCVDIELWMCQDSGYECTEFKKYSNLDREW